MEKSRIQDVNPQVNFSQMEDGINEYWKINDIFQKSIENRPKNRRYSFVDGPPFVSGMPHYGHLLVSVPKDVIPRYWTMKGYRVRRTWGWDCHGLPIEAKVNEKYGIKDRYEIENEIGVEKYVQQCKSFVDQHITDWRWYIEKIGRWVDLDNAYKTMDPEFNESVIWAFKQMWEKGLVYKGKRVSMYSTDTSTPVSGFEVGMDDNYEDVEDLAIFIKFTLKTDKFKDLTGGKPVRLVAWTTTPWTMPANFALVVNENFNYSLVEYEGEYLVFATDRLEYALGDREYKVVKELEGKEFEGLEYEPAYDYFTCTATKNDWHVYVSDEVVADEGTGVLHVAPGFGEVDFKMGKDWGLSDTVHIDDIGNMKNGPWEGVYIRDASPMITEDLEKQGKLFRSEKYLHRLPFYRGKNPLIYMSQDSYFIDIQKIKARMLELEPNVSWMPETFKKRFINVLETSPDWAVSRNRYWATIMPIWESEDGEQLVMGSFDDMMQYTDQIEKRDVDGRLVYYLDNEKLTLHRDMCDKIVLKKDGKEYHRIPEVLDCWMDSGSVPFAEHHYPFENKEAFEEAFPADFIVEYTGQIRAWFNVLFRISTMLFDTVPYKNVICHGVLFGDDGRKMSKSYGNYPDPKETLIKVGGEAMRLYFATSPILMGGDISWSDDTLKDQVKDVLLPIWNTYRYLTMYATQHSWTPTTTEFTSDDVLDKWIESYMKNTTIEYAKALEAYNIPASAQLIQPCIENISRWWIRRSRNRFASGDTNALQTLYATMVLFVKTFAPQMPFLTEQIYQNLVVNAGVKDALESIHLEDYPVFESKDIDYDLLKKMALAREICSNGLKVREDSGNNLRQPLVDAYIGVDDEIVMNIVKEELNVGEVKYSEGPIATENYASFGNAEKFVSLNTEISEELKAQGMVNDFMRKYRDIRKKKGLKVNDRVGLQIYAKDDEIKKALRNFADQHSGDLQANSVEFVESMENPDGNIVIDEKTVAVKLN